MRWPKVTMPKVVEIAVVATTILAGLIFCTYVGYRVGITTPCADEEAFEIHPIP